MTEARFFILLGKKLSREATADELAEIERLLEAWQVTPHQLKMIEDFWQKNPEADKRSIEERWEKIVGKLNEYREETHIEAPEIGPVKGKVFTMRRMLAAASVAALVVFTGWWLWDKGEKTGIEVAEVQTGDSVVVASNGIRKMVLLPDSTTVHLNSGSRLRYNKNFGHGNREVWLSGEAFFEVTKNAAHPFLVNTNRMMVKVLGTVFNVKAYDTREDIETTVVEGKVEVSLKGNEEKKVILLPSEKISLKNNQLVKDGDEVRPKVAGISYEVKTVVPDIKETGMPEEAAWVKEKVVFTDEPFEMVALKMERWYDVHIYFETEKMKTILMTGDFDKVDIQQALKILQMMVNFKYEIKGKEIYIR